MAKNISRFTAEIADYINGYIVPGKNTHIRKCNQSDAVRNRGHVIALELVLPEDFTAEGFESMGPAFYAEELLNEFPDATVAFIAEVINKRVEEFYPSFCTIIQSQAAAMEKSIDDYDINKIILTAQPTALCGKNEYEGFISHVYSELGLTAILKGELCEASSNCQTYYTPIRKVEGHEATPEQWGIAAANASRMADIRIQLMPVMTPSGQSDMPVFGEISDANKFFDFFYLLAEGLWKGAKENFGADKVYIIPNGAYSAIFILDSEAIRNDAIASNMADRLLKKGIDDLKDKPLPVFIVDCATLKITRYKEGM